MAAMGSGYGHNSTRHFGNDRYSTLVAGNQKQPPGFSLVALYLALFYFVMRFVFKA
jgi:hypothetical protein